MNDFGGLALVLLIALAVITVVGHGIWVLLSKLFGGRGPRITERCPNCGAWLPGPVGGCPSCGWAASRSPDHRRQDALKGLFQQTVALERRGLLDAQTKKQLIDSIIAAQRATAGPAAPPSISPATVTTPHTIPVAEVVEQPQPAIHAPQGDGLELPATAARESSSTDVGDRAR